MTVQDRTKPLLEDFDRLAELPENADRLLEYVGGRVVEVVSNNLSSKIAGVILGEVYSFLRGKALGYLTGNVIFLTYRSSPNRDNLNHLANPITLTPPTLLLKLV